MTVLTIAISSTIIASWLISLATFIMWHRMVHREISLLAVSVGALFLSFSFVAQLLLAAGRINLFVIILNPVSLVIGLTLFLWSAFRLLYPKSFWSRTFPALTGLYGLLLAVFLMIGVRTAPQTIGIFAWLYVVPVCFTLGVVYVFGYSQSVLLDTFRRTKAAMAFSLSWFVLGFAYLGVYWAFAADQMTPVYIAMTAAFGLYLLGLALAVRRGRPLNGHREVRPEPEVDLTGDEWRVKFL